MQEHEEKAHPVNGMIYTDARLDMVAASSHCAGIPIFTEIIKESSPDLRRGAKEHIVPCRSARKMHLRWGRVDFVGVN